MVEYGPPRNGGKPAVYGLPATRAGVPETDSGRKLGSKAMREKSGVGMLTGISGRNIGQNYRIEDPIFGNVHAWMRGTVLLKGTF
jgi:hypothetical protein